MSRRRWIDEQVPAAWATKVPERYKPEARETGLTKALNGWTKVGSPKGRGFQRPGGRQMTALLEQPCGPVAKSVELGFGPEAKEVKAVLEV
jgi:hypothetical protein